MGFFHKVLHKILSFTLEKAECFRCESTSKEFYFRPFVHPYARLYVLGALVFECFVFANLIDNGLK